MVERAHAASSSSRAYQRVAQTFATLADPTRARIIHLLVQAEMCTCDLAAVVGITDAAVSQHLRALKNSRMVRARREGKYVYYTLDDAHVALLIQLALTHQHGDRLEPRGPVGSLEPEAIS